MWQQYKRKGLSEMRPYIRGESLAEISVSPVDNPPYDMGMIARNPIRVTKISGMLLEPILKKTLSQFN